MLRCCICFIAFSLLLFVSCESGIKTESPQNTANEEFVEQLKIAIHDSSALEIVDQNARFEILAEGLYWSEGPLWVEEIKAVLFSDVPANKIYKWDEQDGITVFLESAGHSGAENITSDKGPNGLMLDANGNLIICQHGDRRIARMDVALTEPSTKFTTLAGQYKAMQFNSPNDLAISKTGEIYFTDPPYGQPDNKTDEIGINGVFKYTAGQEVTLLIDSLSWPNGVALSLDERTLYVNQSDPAKPVLYSYTIAEDGKLVDGKILFDFSALAANAKGLPDGLKVHKSGNIFATGPGGVHIISPEGEHLATIQTGKATANCAFDADQKYLYTTTTDLLMRIKLK